MICAKNYQNIFKFVKVTHKKCVDNPCCASPRKIAYSAFRLGFIKSVRYAYITNAEVSSRTGLPPIMDLIRRRRLSVFGHIARLYDSGSSCTWRRSLSSRSVIRSSTRSRLETLTWSPSCSLARPASSRHWCGPCQSLETSCRPTARPSWTAWAGYAMTTSTAAAAFASQGKELKNEGREEREIIYLPSQTTKQIIVNNTKYSGRPPEKHKPINAGRLWQTKSITC